MNRDLILGILIGALLAIAIASILPSLIASEYMFGMRNLGNGDNNHESCDVNHQKMHEYCENMMHDHMQDHDEGHC